MGKEISKSEEGNLEKFQHNILSWAIHDGILENCVQLVGRGWVTWIVEKGGWLSKFG